MSVQFLFNPTTHQVTYNIPSGHQLTAAEASAIAQINAAQDIQHLLDEVSSISSRLKSDD